MGNSDSKLNFRKAVVHLTTRNQPIDTKDELFWEQLWTESVDCVQDIFTLMPAAEVRTLRDDAPSNLATLCYKAVEKLATAADTLLQVDSPREQQIVLNCVRLLTRLVPYIFEDPDWRGFFWSSLPAAGSHASGGGSSLHSKNFGDGHDAKITDTSHNSLAHTLLSSLCDLLFCPDFTVYSARGSAGGLSGGRGPDGPEEVTDSCELIWEPGVGCANGPPRCARHDAARTEILKLLLTLFSDTMYQPPAVAAAAIAASTGASGTSATSTTSSAATAAAAGAAGSGGVTCGATTGPAGPGAAGGIGAGGSSTSTDTHTTAGSGSGSSSNSTTVNATNTTCQSMAASEQRSSAASSSNRWLDLFTSSENRHALPLFTSLLNTVCGYDPYSSLMPLNHLLFEDTREPLVEVALQLLIVTLDYDSSDNLFVNYLSRVHRDHDLEFILMGFTRLLNSPLQSSYLPTKKIQFHQELLVLFWKTCDHNRKFLFFVLKSSAVLNILVPTLYHLNEARADQSRVGLVHIGVFILLLLSGERNFGVRLNKPYTASVSMDVPLFSGTHADLLILVFHRMITTGHSRLQPLFDCLLTIIVNVSPYLKSLSMVASSKLLHLLEAFSTPWFLYSNPNNHHLVFFLLEVFNNIIQYQFDGNSNLVYTIIRKRNIFHLLGNLPTDRGTIQRSVASGGSRLSSHVPGGGGHRDTAQTEKQDRRRQQQQQQPQQQQQQTQQRQQQQRQQHQQQQRNQQSGTGDTTDRVDQREQGRQRQSGDASLSGQSDPETPDDERSQSSCGPASLGARKSPDEIAANNHYDPDQKQVVTLAATPRIEKMTEKEEAHKMHNIELDGVLPMGNSSASQGNGVPSGTDEEPRDDERDTSDTTSAGQRPNRDKAFVRKQSSLSLSGSNQGSSRETDWVPTPEWVISWKHKLPLQTIMRLLQVLVPQVEKICIDKGLTDESEILKFLQHGTLVGLLPVPHPILIRKYQANAGTALWFKTYMWGVIYLRNTDPPIWYDTHVQLFQIHTL